VGAVGFEELFAQDTIKMEVIVTFIAVLEMVKRGRLAFMQTEPLGPIWIQHPGIDSDVGEDVELASGDEDHVDVDIEEEIARHTDLLDGHDIDEDHGLEDEPEEDPDRTLNELESES